MLWLRPAIVAGRFYPGDKAKLQTMLEEFYSPPQEKKSVTAVMAPHAGYIYSGKFAGDAYRAIKIPKNIFILCPNHSGRGPRISVWSEGAWQTPLGRVAVQEKLATQFMSEMKIKDGDMRAHATEHAIEVHLPFLQFQRSDVEIIPIVLGPLDEEKCEEVGTALANVIQSQGSKDCLVIASTDMSHYISATAAKAQDEIALNEVQKVNPRGLYDAVIQRDISMCGFIPTTATLKACQILGVKEAKLLSYGHSGEATGDSSSVVAYASALFE